MEIKIPEIIKEMTREECYRLGFEQGFIEANCEPTLGVEWYIKEVD